MTNTPARPALRPANPCFSTGPTAKRPGWSTASLADACLGRSHRSAPARAKLAEVITRSRAILGIPADYQVAIVPGSDTAAVEIALWSLLGPRPVDVLAWESFGEGWASDIAKQLKLPDARFLRADYGRLPDLTQVSQQTFERMKAERLAEAELIRARGNEAAQRIRAIADRQVVEIVSEAARDAEIIRGEGDGERNRIFAEAFSTDAEFFEFYRSMNAYSSALSDSGTTMVLSPTSEFFRFFGNAGGTAPAANAAPAN